jgi:acyl-CoA thioesterase
MSSPTSDIAALLCVEHRSDREYTADPEDFWGAPLAADVWARVALAAARSGPGAELITLQGGLPELELGKPVSLRISPSGGPTVPHRHVEIAQAESRGHALATLVAPGAGPDYQDVFPLDRTPEPESLPSTLETARAEGWPEQYARGPVEFRRIGPRQRDAEADDASCQRVWLSPRTPVPEGPDVAVAAIVLAASWYPHWEFERRIGAGFSPDRFRVLDHSVRIHRAEPWRDAWLLEARSERAIAGRALSTRRLFSRDGRLLASASSSALVTG